jgi:hypothetical protein
MAAGRRRSRLRNHTIRLQDKSGQGFRRFRIPAGATFKVFHVDDMVAVRPFEDAANRTATLFLRKGADTEYPVPYLVWRRQSSGISAMAPLPHIVRKFTSGLRKRAPSLRTVAHGSPLQWDTRRPSSGCWAETGCTLEKGRSPISTTSTGRGSSGSRVT